MNYHEFSKVAPKHFVGLTLTAGEDVNRGFHKLRHEQELKDFQEIIRAIFRKVDNRAKKEGWQYKAYVCFSDEHLSRDTPEYNASGEMGKDNKDKITNWHCHFSFYSDTYDLEALKHIANVVRKYWISGARPKTKGGDKGGYNIGSYLGSKPAVIADLGWYYYCKEQEFSKMLKSESGAVKVDEWKNIISKEWDALDDDCSYYLEHIRIPYLKDNHAKAEKIKAQNTILQFEGLKEYGRNLTQLLNFVPEVDRHKSLSQLKAEGFDFNKAIRQCFSGVSLLDEYVEPYWNYNRNLHKHMKEKGIALADSIDFEAYDKEEVLKEVRRISNTKRIDSNT